MFPDIQRGFALISAIFILVVLAALGGFIATISTTQNLGSALDVQSAYAYQAARAGIEWGAYTVLNNSPATPANTTTASATHPSPAILLNGMTVTVNLYQKAAAPGTVTPAGVATEPGLFSIWAVTSIACNLPTAGNCPETAANPNASNPNYVERKLTVLVEHP